YSVRLTLNEVHIPHGNSSRCGGKISDGLGERAVGRVLLRSLIFIVAEIFYIQETPPELWGLWWYIAFVCKGSASQLNPGNSIFRRSFLYIARNTQEHVSSV